MTTTVLRDVFDISLDRLDFRIKYLMEGWLFYCSSVIIVSVIGRWIINKLIASDYDINSNLAIFLFCLTFSLSVISLELIIFDVVGVGSEENRKTKWYKIDKTKVPYTMDTCNHLCWLDSRHPSG